MMKKGLVAAVMVAVVIASTVGVMWRLRPWRSGVHVVTTGAKPQPTSLRAEGRVVARPGASVTLSAEMLGTVTQVNVVEGQQVRKGDTLLEFRKTEQLARLNEAWASGGEASARLRARSADVRRAKLLVDRGATPERDKEVAAEEEQVARAKLQAAGAEAAKVRALLEKTRIASPIDGVVISRTVERYETVAPGTPLFVVVDLTQLRIESEVDEFDAGRLHMNARVTISAEGFPDRVWRGLVEEIPVSIVPRHLRSHDPARITDSGVILAKLSVLNESPLKLGQRVLVTISTEPGADELTVRWP